MTAHATTSRASRASTSDLGDVEQQLATLTEHVASLTTFVTELNATTLTQQEILESISRQCARPSTALLDETTKTRLSEIEKTLGVIGAQLASSAAVKLPDNTKVTKSDVAAWNMMQTLRAELTTMSSNFERLKASLDARGNVVIDTRAVSQRATEQFAAAVTTATQEALATTRDQFVQTEASITAARERSVDQLHADLEVLMARAESFSAKLDQRAQVTTWDQAGRILAALTPFLLVIIVLGGIGQTIASWLGLGVLPDWAWGIVIGRGHHESFTRICAFLAILTTLGVLTWATYRLGSWLRDIYRGWEKA